MTISDFSVNRHRIRLDADEAGSAAPPSPALRAWVDEIAALTKPDEIVWCDGSRTRPTCSRSRLVAEGKLIKLNPEWRPNSFLARTDPSDVARVEDRTFICSDLRGGRRPHQQLARPARDARGAHPRSSTAR